MSVNVPHQLVEVVPNSTKLGVEKPSEVIILRGRLDISFALIEHKRAAKMNRPHADSFGALPQALIFRCRQAQIKLLQSPFSFGWPPHAHVISPWQSAASWGLGAIRAAPNEKPFA